jgi:hypothetical protein
MRPTPPLYPHYSPHSAPSKCGRSLCPTLYKSERGASSVGGFYFIFILFYFYFILFYFYFIFIFILFLFYFYFIFILFYFYFILFYFYFILFYFILFYFFIFYFYFILFYFRIKYHKRCTMLCFFDCHELMNHPQAYFVKVAPYSLSKVPSYKLHPIPCRKCLAITTDPGLMIYKCL